MGKNERGSFSGGIGFVLAAAGSAVGLGNLWRFPYLAAQYGGGIFIVVYIILALTFGYALMTTEIAIGRKTKAGPLAAYGKIDRRFRFLGLLGTLVPMIILPYYCVIGGWVTKYMMTFLTMGGKDAADDSYFGGFIGDATSPLVYFAVFLLITSVVILLGVQNGIEKISKFLMPLLVIISIVICVYVCTLPGVGEGIKYYLLPDIHKFGVKTICAAMGQMFFSMSLAMGIMVAYGSYTRDNVSLVKSVNQIEIFDTAIALLAGFMVVPSVYVFSGEEGCASGGAGLMFITLPKVFAQMPGGQIIGILFFVLVFFAALTSCISIMEAVVSSFIDTFHISRSAATGCSIILAIVLGVPSSLGNGLWANITILGMDFLTFFDFISNSIIMPIVALVTCIMIGWVTGVSVVEDEVTKNGEHMARKAIYEIMTKYFSPVFMVIILVFYTLAQFGVITY